MNLRPLGYEPSELPNCSTPRRCLYSMNSRVQKQIGDETRIAWQARVGSY